MSDTLYIRAGKNTGSQNFEDGYLFIEGPEATIAEIAAVLTEQQIAFGPHKADEEPLIIAGETSAVLGRRRPFVMLTTAAAINQAMPHMAQFLTEAQMQDVQTQLG